MVARAGLGMAGGGAGSKRDPVIVGAGARAGMRSEGWAAGCCAA